MALSGFKEVAVTSHNKLRFSWWQTSQDIAANKTKIGWNMTLSADANGYISSTVIKAYGLTINGTNYTGTNRIAINSNSTITLAAGETEITHNADGTKEFSYAFAQQFKMTFAGVWVDTIQETGTGTLETIPRKATLLSAPDFTDEDNPTITYSNPAGDAVTALDICISFTGAKDDVAYRAISKSGTSYTFNLTDAERKTLRQWVTNGSDNREVTFYLRTTINNTLNYHTATKTLTVINAMPELEPTVIDVGATSTQLTGNPNTMIKYFNDMKVAINSSAKKEATIVKNYLKCGNNYVEKNEHHFTYVDSNYFKFTTVDNRGNTVSKEIIVPMVDYIPLTANVEASIGLSSADGTKAEITLKINGDYFGGTFGAVNNSLTINYTVTSNNNTSNTYSLLIPDNAIKASSYDITHTITNLDYRNSYVITVEVKDEIATLNIDTKTLKAVPIFDWGENDFNFNVPVTIQGTELDYPIEQGTKDGWFYRNWKSGKGECWKVLQVNTTINTAWGSLYVGDNKMTRQNYPYPFKSKPVEVANVAAGSNAAWLFAESNGNGVNGTYASAIYNICRPTATATTQTFYIMLYAYGEL